MPVKPSLILIPGRLCDARLFRHQLQHLEDYAKITVADITHHNRLELMAQEILANAPPQFVLAGLSLGGIVAMEIMLQAPTRVTKLALLDTNPGGNTPELVREFEEQVQEAQDGHFREVAIDMCYPPMVHPLRLNDKQLIAEVWAMAQAVGVAGFTNQVTAMLHRQTRWHDLAQISCPTLVLCGREDEACPLALHEKMARLIPAARLVVIENCGHLSTMEQPESVTAALKTWLTA